MELDTHYVAILLPDLKANVVSESGDIRDSNNVGVVLLLEITRDTAWMTNFIHDVLRNLRLNFNLGVPNQSFYIEYF